jgi:short-subunit dehydrogenase
MVYLNGKNILVTGASSGIGSELCLELAKLSCNIALVARREERLFQLAEKIEVLGGKALVLKCDVSDYMSVKESHKELMKHFEKIDFAFLNAGIGSSALIQNLSAYEVQNVMQTNFMGVINWLEYLLQDMQRSNSGTIIFTSSLITYRSMPGCSSYCASKAALHAFVESARLDLLATKIKLVTISPYFIETEMTGGTMGRNPIIWNSSQKAVNKIICGLEKNKIHITFPWHFHVVMYLLRMLPVSCYDLLWKIVRRGG